MIKRFFLILIFFTLLSVFFTWQGIYLPKDYSSEKEVIFNIEKGLGSKEIASNLEEQGLIRWGILFRFYVLYKGVSGILQAGTYKLSSAMNIPQMVEKFVSGEVLKEKITIIEGWTKEDIASYLEEKQICLKPEFLSLVKEGYSFPDTYFVERGSSCNQLVNKILDNFDRKFSPELREEAERQGKSIFEILTMASLIEKEVKTFEDKKLVSGILWKRLENGIPLQVDATIVYITGKKTTKVSKEETQIDSPYNTYKYQGLPLGPICNPGLESIEASLYPEESEYWYYLSTPEGKTIFSKTLEEHNIAKAKYLK